MNERFTFILVHGAWHGSWAWDTIVPRLKAAGHDAIAVDLPGNGRDSTPPQQVTLELYTAHVAKIVDAVAGRVILVGHSMGGMTVAQTCEVRPERVALAIYLCAFVLPDGMSVLEFYGKYLQPWMRGAHARVTHDAQGFARRSIRRLRSKCFIIRRIDRLPKPRRGGSHRSRKARDVRACISRRAVRQRATRLYRGARRSQRASAVAAEDAGIDLFRRGMGLKATMRRNCRNPTRLPHCS